MAFLIGQNGFKIPVPADGVRRKLGRADDCEIVVPDPAVSRHHLFLTSTLQGEILVENASPQNAFYINGQLAQGTATVRISDRLAFGSQDYLFSNNENEKYSTAPRLDKSQFSRLGSIPASYSNSENSYQSAVTASAVRDIGPFKMVFAVFVALVILAGVLRNMEDSEKNKVSKIDSTPAKGLPQEGYKPSQTNARSQTEIQSEAKFRESLRDYYNKNYSRAIIGFNEALILNPGHEECADFLQLAQGELKTQLKNLLDDGLRSYSNLQFRRSKGQALRILTILGEQIPSYSRKIIQDVISGRQIASTTQEDLMLNLPCEKSKETELCKKALSLLIDSRRLLKEEESIR